MLSWDPLSKIKEQLR